MAFWRSLRQPWRCAGLRCSIPARTPPTSRGHGAGGTAHDRHRPQTAPAYMTETALAFNEQLERISELGVVVLLGAMLSRTYLLGEALWFVPLLLLVIRPVATGLGLIGSRTSPIQRRLIGWFGIRGIGRSTTCSTRSTTGCSKTGPPVDHAHLGGGGGVYSPTRSERRSPDAPLRPRAGTRPHCRLTAREEAGETSWKCQSEGQLCPFRYEYPASSITFVQNVTMVAIGLFLAYGDNSHTNRAHLQT